MLLRRHHYCQIVNHESYGNLLCTIMNTLQTLKLSVTYIGLVDFIGGVAKWLRRSVSDIVGSARVRPNPVAAHTYSISVEFLVLLILVKASHTLARTCFLANSRNTQLQLKGPGIGNLSTFLLIVHVKISSPDSDVAPKL